MTTVSVMGEDCNGDWLIILVLEFCELTYWNTCLVTFAHFDRCSTGAPALLFVVSRFSSFSSSFLSYRFGFLRVLSTFIPLPFLHIFDVSCWKMENKEKPKKEYFGLWYAQVSSVGIERRRVVWPFTNFPSKDQVWAASGTGSYILFDVNGVERVLIWRSDW